MSEPEKKPSYDAGRRIRWLTGIVLAVVALYSAAWFWVAGQVDRAARTFAAESVDFNWSCPGQAVRGYPFRVGVFCDALNIGTADGAVSVTGGAVRSAAQVYDPRRIIAEVESPVTVTDGGSGRSYTLTWRNARANAVTAPVAARMIAFEADQVELSMGGLIQAVTASEIGIYAREQGGALDIAARPRELVIDTVLTAGRNLPPFGLDVDVRLFDWQRDWAGPVRGGKGEVRRLSLLLTNDRGVIIAGPFSVAPDGLISGEFSVRIVDLPGVLVAARQTFADHAAQIEALAQAQPRQQGLPDDELQMKLTVRDGRVFAGLIPLGRIPPVPLGGLAGL